MTLDLQNLISSIIQAHLRNGTPIPIELPVSFDNRIITLRGVLDPSTAPNPMGVNLHGVPAPGAPLPPPAPAAMARQRPAVQRRGAKKPVKKRAPAAAAAAVNPAGPAPAAQPAANRRRRPPRPWVDKAVLMTTLQNSALRGGQPFTALDVMRLMRGMPPSQRPVPRSVQRAMQQLVQQKKLLAAGRINRQLAFRLPAPVPPQAPSSTNHSSAPRPTTRSTKRASSSAAAKRSAEPPQPAANAEVSEQPTPRRSPSVRQDQRVEAPAPRHTAGVATAAALDREAMVIVREWLVKRLRRAQGAVVELKDLVYELAETKLPKVEPRTAREWEDLLPGIANNAQMLGVTKTGGKRYGWKLVDPSRRDSRI